MKRLTWFVFVVAACGGSEKPTTTPAGGDEHKEAKEPELTPELTAFHDVLSPKWHADKGEARMKDTCGAIADFQAKAAAVKAAPAKPGVDAAVWTEAGSQLDTSVAGLATACGGTDLAAFETAFSTVHDAFHRAMELVIGEHDKDHGEHSMESGAH